MSSIGGPIRNFYVIDEMDLKENGGRYSIRGGYAIRVSGFDREIPTGGRVVMAGPKQPVYIVSKGQLRENGGRYVLKGGPGTSAIPASALIRPTTKVLGGPAIPVLVEEGLLGGFRPDELPDLWLWYDAQSLSTLFQNNSFTTPVTSDGDPVGGWKDKSGNNFHAKQSALIRRPTYKIVDGLPFVSFDNTDDFLRLVPNSNYSDWTVFFVLRPKSISATAEYIFNIGDVGSPDRWIFGRHINKLAYFDANPGWHDTSSDIIEDTLQIYSFRLQSTNSGEVRVNDTLIGSGLPFTKRKLVKSTIGTNNNGQPSTKLEMDLGEVIFFQGALTDSQHDDVIAYLESRWLISQPQPPDIPNLAFWLKADDLTTLFQDAAFTTPVTSDGDPVGGWKDKSGNNFNFNQSVLAKRPTYSSTEPSVSFDDTDDYLQRFFSAGDVPDTDFTVFIAADLTNTDTQEVIFESSVAVLTFFNVKNGITLYETGGDGQQGTVPAVSGLQLITYRLESLTSGEISINGVVLNSGLSYTKTNLQGTTIIGANTLGGSRVDGKIFEFICYQRALSDSEKNDVTNYLLLKWGI